MGGRDAEGAAEARADVGRDAPARRALQARGRGDSAEGGHRSTDAGLLQFTQCDR